MSVLSSRVSLTHRLTVQRDQSLTGTDDGWGNPDVPNFVDYLTDVPCRAWTAAGPRPGTENVGVAAVVVDTGIRAHVPLGTDVTEKDRVASISHRGAVIFPGPLDVEAVLTYPDHLELVLRRVT